MFCIVLSSRLYVSLLNLCVCVYSILEVSVGCIFMLGRMIGSVQDNGVCKGGFSKDGYCS